MLHDERSFSIDLSAGCGEILAQASGICQAILGIFAVCRGLGKGERYGAVYGLDWEKRANKRKVTMLHKTSIISIV